MKPHLILGIDPGASGGIAELWADGKAALFPMMDDIELRDYIGALAISTPDTHVVMELVGGFVGGKGQPGSHMFRFGEGYGYIQGLLAAHRLPLSLVRPQLWQKGIPGVAGQEKPARKRALKEHAGRLFPHIKGVTLKTCDALLIAEWGRRNLFS